MRPTQLLAELLVVGTITLIGFLGLYYPDLISFAPQSGVDATEQFRVPRPNVALQLLAFSAIAYLIGYGFSVLSEVAFSPLKARIETRYLKQRLAINLDAARYQIYTSGQDQVTMRLEYHRSFIRLSRSLALASIVLASLVVWSDLEQAMKTKLVVALLSSSAILTFAYARRVWWFTKTTYLSWVALDTWTPRKDRTAATPADTTAGTSAAPQGPRVVLLAGGTASRGISRSISQRSSSLSRVVPVFDNGGSSEKLRKAFGILPVGDIRHALIALSPQQGPMRPVVRLCNWRFPIGSDVELSSELDDLTRGRHPLMSAVESDVRGVLMGYLESFRDQVPPDFDLSNGSVGNFVLVGAYLAHRESITTAIFNFRKICGIPAQVVPISLENDLHLGAELAGVSEPVLGQVNITKLDRSVESAPIDRVFLTRGIEQGAKAISHALPNPIVIDDISRAELLVFGPGSFFTSVLPHFLVKSIAETIADVHNIPKVLLTNLTESEETSGLTHEMLLLKLFETIDRHSSGHLSPSSYVTHVLVNNPHGSHTYQGGRRYLPNGDLDRFKRDGIEIISSDLEDCWRRGSHDPERVTELLLDLV